MKKYLSLKLITILIVTLVLVAFDLPASVQSKFLPFSSETLQKTKVHLGLDLQGGSQLDYKIDLRKVPEADREGITEGVLQVIEKRVNNLGVAEPNIYQSDIAGEKHIIVEIAETAAITQEDVDNYLGEQKAVANLSDDEKKLVSLEKAKATVGKTIQLEFKEEKLTMDPKEKEKVQENAKAALEKIKNGSDYSVVGQEDEQAFPGKVKYEKSEYIFESDLNQRIKESLTNLEVGNYTQELLEVDGGFIIDSLTGEAIQDSYLAIIKLIDVKEEVKNSKEVDTSHILITWAGLDNAGAEITRTEEEASERAKEVQKKINDGGDFAALAKEYSDDNSTKDDGGKLSKAVTGDGSYAYDYEQTALKLEESKVSDIVKSPSGYHLIKADSVRENAKEKQYKYEAIEYSLKPDPWQDTGLTGEHFVHADVQLDNFFQPYVSIQFNDEGAKLFEEITGRNINRPIAIFVGGELISAPNVQTKIIGGNAVIQGNFTNDEAKNLARDLNTGAIPAPIVLTGEYTIGATLGKAALNESMWAGLIGILLVIIFMIAYYRLPGIVASAALIIYGLILGFLIKSQLHLGYSLVISLIIFGFLVWKIVNNRDSGWEKFLSFLLSCVGFFFLTFLLKTGVVLTLAGIAGVILSLGMAVDANILIFERFKEELRDGKTINSAIESGFNRAWSAIRDSNFSTLITCAILFYFGSSIIRGFAFNLAAGVLVSMFTAITVTRTLLQGFVGRKIAQNLKAFGHTEKAPRTRDFIKKSKTWFSLSGSLVVISIIAMFTFGLNLGIDFKGGTLLEFQFSEPVTKESLNTNLKEIEKEINNGQLSTIKTTEAEAEAETETETETDTEKTQDDLKDPALIPASKADDLILREDEETGTVDLTNIQIIESGTSGYIVKTKYLSSANHDQLIAKMKERLPEFNEPRFTTIGPTIGKTLLHKAIIAMALALVMIIIYVAFAFRKIPKEVSPWKFGASAIVALAHDVIIVTGLFVILSQFVEVEIDALFITAMMTVFGYSVNDTIVVLDRLRENLIHHSSASLTENANRSLSETLARSINTSLSTGLALLAVLLFGSPAIFFFVLALTAGILIGTYSSIFLATPLLVYWNKKKE